MTIKGGFIMKDSVFQMTSDTYQSLSDSERHLLEYIYQHLDVIATLSIVKLSEDANVSTATIVRLMKKLGYDGYTSFKYALKEKHHLGHAPLMDDIDSQIEKAEKRLASVQQQKINSDTIYKYLLYFDKYYDSITDAEKKEFMQTP